MSDQFLNIFFHLLHLILIIFNLFGWIWKKTLKLHLISLMLTLLSWFGLGIFYGIGYCPITQWHWETKIRRGERGLPNSYIKYLLDNITGLDLSPTIVDAMTFVSFFIALSISLYLNIKNHKRESRTSRSI